MSRDVRPILNLYNPNDPLDHASTIPSPWYFDDGIGELEDAAVFGRNLASRWPRRTGSKSPANFLPPTSPANPSSSSAAKMRNSAPSITSAAITPPPSSPKPQGCAKQFRCPYHGWTYGIDGALKGMVEFDGVCNFDRADNGLVPVRVDIWENFVFVNLDPHAALTAGFSGRSSCP